MFKMFWVHFSFIFYPYCYCPCLFFFIILNLDFYWFQWEIYFLLEHSHLFDWNGILQSHIPHPKDLPCPDQTKIIKFIPFKATDIYNSFTELVQMRPMLLSQDIIWVLGQEYTEESEQSVPISQCLNLLCSDSQTIHIDISSE